MAVQGSNPAVDTTSVARKDEMPTPATSAPGATTVDLLALEP